MELFSIRIQRTFQLVSTAKAQNECHQRKNGHKANIDIFFHNWFFKGAHLKGFCIACL